MASSETNGKSHRDGDDAKDPAVAKTAGFVVFSGIAMSLIKALLPRKQESPPSPPPPSSPPPSPQASSPPPRPLTSSRQPPPRPPSVDLSVKEPKTQGRPSRTIEIVKGDTLWGLSRKYGVSIDAIKEANGLSGDTIYAGKNLIIP